MSARAAAFFSISTRGKGWIQAFLKILWRYWSDLGTRALTKRDRRFTNGTALMAALGSLAVAEAENIALAANVAGALSLEALNGTARAFDPRIHQARPHPRQGAGKSLAPRRQLAVGQVKFEPRVAHIAWQGEILRRQTGVLVAETGDGTRALDVDVPLAGATRTANSRTKESKP